MSHITKKEFSPISLKTKGNRSQESSNSPNSKDNNAHALNNLLKPVGKLN